MELSIGSGGSMNEEQKEERQGELIRGRDNGKKGRRGKGEKRREGGGGVKGLSYGKVGLSGICKREKGINGG